jgi:D-alanyl-D-alanine carboxypeptidase
MRLAIIALLLLCTSLSFAQTNLNKEKLDKYLETLDVAKKAMFSLAISENGKVIYQNSIGFASLEDNLKPNSNTQYRIGSISKVFTATLIFQLIETGELSLDTKLSDYYPKVKNADKIKISHLLSHRSGIHNFTDDPDFPTYMNRPKSKAEMVSLIENLDSDFEPNSKASYSNSAFVLLGYIIEDISGTSYKKHLHQNIVDKLGLIHTTYGGPIKTDKNQAKSYAYTTESWVASSIADMSIPGGAGALVSTPTELNQFMHGLFAGELISNASLSKMKEINQGYGRGLFQFPFNGKIAFGHNGGIDSFVSNTAYFESENIGVSITFNGLNYVMNDVLIGVLSITFGKNFEIPSFNQTVLLSAGELKNYEGTFSSVQIPLKIVIKATDGKLTAQATGQGAFPLTPSSKTEFKYDAAGVIMVFKSEDDNDDYEAFILKQGGQQFTFNKEK